MSLLMMGPAVFVLSMLAPTYSPAMALLDLAKSIVAPLWPASKAFVKYDRNDNAAFMAWASPFFSL
jgi:hypothetical protein